MKVLFLLLLLPLQLLAQPDTTWAPIGAPRLAYTVRCMTSLGPDEDTLLCGTWPDRRMPQSGGIFRHTGSDTVWTPSGLMYRFVEALEHFPHRPDAVYAAANDGLYASVDRGMSWQLVSVVDTEYHWSISSFQISPFDTSLWVAGAADNAGEGHFFVSHDAGHIWSMIYNDGAVTSVQFSRLDSNTVYFSELTYTYRVDLRDSSYTRIHYWHDSNVEAMLVHPTAPWLYILGRDSIARYDEVSGQIIFLPIPTAGGLWKSMKLDPDNKLLIGAYYQLYRVSEDLQSWEVMPNPIVGYGGDFLFASDAHWIVYTLGQLYCRSPFPTAAVEPLNTAVHSIRLAQNYPNPFNPETRISFDLPRASHTTLEVFDITGRTVATLINGMTESGHHDMVFNGNSLSSGVYFYRLQSGGVTATNKMLLLK